MGQRSVCTALPSGFCVVPRMSCLLRIVEPPGQREARTEAQGHAVERFKAIDRLTQSLDR
jgi:hypothetical protein